MLTASAVANAKPEAKACKITDGRGLYLLVKPDGAKWWRFDYRRPATKKRNTLSMGTYPDVSLKGARERREAARKMLAAGIDPGDQRKATHEAAADTFTAVAREWYAKHVGHWAPSHASKVIRRLERDVFPYLGGKPVASITAPDVLAVLRRVEARGVVETAHRALQNVGRVFRYAVATGRADADPTQALHGALTPPDPQHFAAVTEPRDVASLLRAIDGYAGHPVTRAALQLAPLVFVRPGELRQAEWAGIDLDAAEWRYHVTKTNTDHIVPLSTQAVAILRDLYPLTGAGRYVFPGLRTGSGPMSENTVNAALRRLGYDKATMTGHGFRAMARTMLDEQLGFRPDFIEHQLAHAVRDPNGRAYNRTAHLAERKAMMQQWADYLDALKTGSNVVPIGRKAST